MAIKSGYFNSVSGDRKYNAEDMTMYFKGLVSDGVYQTVGNMLAVTPGDGLTVSVDTGRALVNMHWIENSAMMNIDLGSASVSADTYKLIVLRCDLSESVRSVSIIVKDSNNGSVVLINDENITELCLARVRIRKNASTISQSDVRDYRGSTYCPWITGLIQQVDVSKLNEEFYAYYDEQTKTLDAWFDQQKKDFENWLATLQSELTVNTKLKTYQYVYKTASETAEIPLIEQYETGDSLLIHIGGVLFVETNEFTIDIANRKIILKNSVTANNTITQILLKSVIGGSSWYTTNYSGNTFTWNSTLTSVNIPEGTKTLGIECFAGATNLTSVTIPDSVTTICAHAFRNCSSLASISIPDSVNLIDQYAFFGCTSLTSITIPEGVKYIATHLFDNCTSLANVTIPNSVTGIDPSAFWGCSALTSVTIPESVTYIGEKAFFSCSNLTNVTIPNSVTGIGPAAFYSCSKITELVVPSSVTGIGADAFKNVQKVVYSGTASGSPWGANEVVTQ